MVSFELPRKGDLDRTLSVLMHDARHRVQAECNDLVPQAVRSGTLQSSRQTDLFFRSADSNHERAMGDATIILRQFIERTEASPPEIVGWARPILENLGDALLTVPKPLGFPKEHRRLMLQYGAIFRQRLDGMLRDVEIGYVPGEGFAPSFSGEGAPFSEFAAFGPQPVPRVFEATIEERIVLGDAVSVEQRLSERPQDIREAARALSRAISEQIDELNALKPNDPDALTRQQTFVAFMQRIATGLDELAASLERINIEPSASRGPLYAKSAAIARSLGKSVTKGLVPLHRDYDSLNEGSG
jgi:hypothetical protein